MYFQRGTLTPEQVKLVLRDLPVDISFADENDVLVYWSGSTYKTCDARFIGRDMRDCHPPESMECLEEILRAFKAGEKDTAEGWHAEGDHFSYTRYKAIRDRTGAYRGILEVNQELCALRALEGERALPGW
jgi:DUF438 domain-containing protein